MSRIIEKFDLEKITGLIKKPWTPVDVVEINDYVLRVALMEGEYHWHVHEVEDEVFLVYKGTLLVETEEGSAALTEGEGVLVPGGIRHRTAAKKPSFVLMLELKALKSTGSD